MGCISIKASIALCLSLSLHFVLFFFVFFDQAEYYTSNGGGGCGGDYDLVK